VIDLNALLRRRVGYYEYPWTIEIHLLNARSLVRSLFQADDVAFIFCKSMPRSGQRFLAECLNQYFQEQLSYCEYYRAADCCRRIPCARPKRGANRFFAQKSHDFGLRDSKLLKGK
jgi:hypothetical protein